MQRRPLFPNVINPDGQPELPLQGAQDYAETVTAWAQEPLPRSVVVSRDIAYGPHRLQRYNVFAPRGAARVPVLVFWHGGGWTHGYREWQTFMALRVTALGLVMVAPSYRLAPECPLPDAHHDSMALLVELQSRLPYFGGAADHLYLAGHSAGGHLAALAALRRADRAAAGLPDDVVKGCLPISGIMDLHHPDAPAGSWEERVYTTVLRGRDATQATVNSPLYWTAGNTVPFELTYGEKDSPQVMQSNRRLHALLQAQGVALGCVVEPGRDHFQTHTALRNPGDSWYLRLLAMVARHSPSLVCP